MGRIWFRGVRMFGTYPSPRQARGDFKGKEDKKNIHMPMGMIKDSRLDGTIAIVVSGGMYFSRDDFKCSPFNEAYFGLSHHIPRDQKEELRSGREAPYSFGTKACFQGRPPYAQIPAKGSVSLVF